MTSDDKKPFSAGAYPDMEPSAVPARGVHYVKNYRVYNGRLLARPGSRRWSDTPLPSLRTGYSFTKSGTTVTKSAGDNFSATDVGNYIVHDDGAHERIEQYLSTTSVRVNSSTARAASTSGWVRGPKNAIVFHKTKRLIILFIDSRLFYSDVYMTEWLPISKWGTFSAPASTISRMRVFDDFVVLFNATAMTKIDLVNFVYWKMNAECPQTRVTDVLAADMENDENLKTEFARNIVYSMGRLSGTASQTRDRFTENVEIVQETGTVVADGSGKDYGEIHSPYRFGEGSTTFGRLVCGTLASPYDVPSGFSGISDGHVKIPLNGTTYEAAADFTGIVSLAEAAERLQTALRDFVSTVEVEFEEDHFVITVPDENGTVGYADTPVSGTDISSAIKGKLTDGAMTNNISFTMPAIIGDLEIPSDAETSRYHSHFDVYSIYSSLDTKGVNLLTGEVNNPQLFVWQMDVPVAKAFVASRSGITITATEGTFQPCDRGSVLRFQDGTEVTLKYYLTPTTMTTDDSGSITSQAAAIGGDGSVSKAIRVMTAHQAGYTVTRTGGDTFTSIDAGRPIFWPDGTQSLITAYVSANEVTVKVSATIAETGACIEPKTRKYCDTIRDEVSGNLANLRSRVEADTNKYFLQTRLFLPMPACDMGEITANMLWAIVAGENKLYYCAADVNYRFQAGYYYADKQMEIFQDAIYEISEVSNMLSVKCAHSTRAIPLNQFGSYKINSAGVAVVTAAGQDMVDERIGVKHFGGVLPLDRSRQLVITSEPALRVFDATSYGENVAAERIQKIIEGCQAAYAMGYDSVNGATLWFLEE